MELSPEKLSHEFDNLLERHDLDATDAAATPLSKLDFDKLVGVFDHEENYLRKIFEDNLIEARKKRLKKSPYASNKITINDVRKAMVGLGKTMAKSEESVFSKTSKSALTDICPYC